MSNDDIRLSVEVDTNDAVDDLTAIADASADAGEALDRLDGDKVKVDSTAATSALDDVRSAADDASTAVDRLDGQRVDISTRGATDGLKDITDESGRARDSVNTSGAEGVKALGEMAGATGPVSEGLGQVAEQALAGELSLSQLGTAGAGLAGLGIVMFGLQQRAKQLAENLEQITTATDNLSKVADDQVLYELGRAMTGAFLAGEDLNDTFKKMAEDNLPGFRRALDVARSSGDVTAETIRMMQAALTAVETEMAQQEQTSRDYGDSLDSVTTGAEDTAAALPTLVDPLAAVEGAMTGAAEATAAFDQATSDLLAQIDDRQAYLNVVGSIETFVRKMGDGTSTTREQEQAFLAAKEAILRYITTAEDIPTDIKTEVTAAIREGDIGEAYRVLEELANTRFQVKVDVGLGTVTGAFAGIIGGASGGRNPYDRADAAQIINYYPPRISGVEQFRAQTAYQRINGG
jgi:hypothetical protein